jgi:hypothetical protein
VSAPRSLIDEYLPEFDVVERHATLVRAAPARVWSVLRTADFGRSVLVAVLLGVRGLGRRRVTLTLGTMLAAGRFVQLDERPGRELLIGLEGRFWRPRPDLRTTDARRFREPLDPGLARAAWDFRLEPLGEDTTRLSTETRVCCADAAARRRFRPYWLLVRPGSGLIRRAMLGAIRRAAEGPGETSNKAPT